MHGPTTFVIRPVFLGALALQVACGGDSTAPPTPTSIVANSTTTLTGSAGASVAERPSVIVLGQSGAPLGGVTVTFVVTNGGGTVAGASVATDAAGIATVGSWTLGTPGVNTLTASAAGLAPVTFTATASVACTAPTPHTFGTTTDGDLSEADCLIGARVDFYTTSIATAGAYVFNEASTTIDTYLVLFSPERGPGETTSNNGLVAGDDDSGGATNSMIKVFLTPGTYTLAATSFEPQFGAYTLSSASASSNIASCEQVFTVRGISTAQTLESTDCALSGFYSDDMFIFLRMGQSMTITMTSTAFDTRLDIYTGPTTRVATNEDPASRDARIVYTAPAEGYYLIAPTSTVAGAGGAYTLAIQ